MAKMGCVAYGGGPSMIPLIKAEVVEVHNWVSIEDFTDALAVGNALPGPIATKMAAYIGNKVAGPAGAFMAVCGLILPSIVMVLLLISFINAMRNNPRIESMLKGLRPVVVAMLAFAAYDMVPSSMKGILTWCIGVVALLLMVFTKIHPALLVVAGAAAGIVLKL
jgi:chromate transporter